MKQICFQRKEGKNPQNPPQLNPMEKETERERILYNHIYKIQLGMWLLLIYVGEIYICKGST